MLVHLNTSDNCQYFALWEPLRQSTPMKWDIIAILSKHTFNNIGEKHINHFVGLPVVFFGNNLIET